MRAVITPSMRSDNPCVRHEHAMSAPRPRSQPPLRTPWECGGTRWTLLGNATVAVGEPWHLHVMENVKLFARSLYFRAIPQRSMKFQIAVPTPWDRGRVWQELYIVVLGELIWNVIYHGSPVTHDTTRQMINSSANGISNIKKCVGFVLVLGTPWLN